MFLTVALYTEALSVNPKVVSVNSDILVILNP